MKSLTAVLTIASLSASASALTVLETQSAWTGGFITNVSNGPVVYNFGESFQVPLSGDTIFDKGFLNVRTLQGRTVTMGIAAYTPVGSTIGSPISTQSFNVIGNGLWQQLAFDPIDIPLTPGGFYALFVQATLSPVSFDIGSTPGTAYVPGRYLVGPNLPGTIQNFASDDAAFRVELVPAPGALALLIGAVPLFRRRNK
ncbi:MAG: hypothetical protein K8R92_08490 [Planctomycetes bacterium]|nr:hypothetical protein [Planctomycetota bacterium]